jgi:hypothetical protein
MNNASNNGSPDDGEEHGELVWNEFDWERYLRQRDEALTEYSRCYDQVTEFPDRLDEVARRLGWEPTLDGEAPGADEDDFDDDDLDPYTLHRNPVYVATRALFSGLVSTVEAHAVAADLAPSTAFPLLRALQQAEMAVVLGVQSLDLGDSALGIAQLKRALGLLNSAMGLLPETEGAAVGPSGNSPAPSLGEYALPRLFDLREICLRVVRECREELQRPLDDEED